MLRMCMCHVSHLYVSSLIYVCHMSTLYAHIETFDTLCVSHVYLSSLISVCMCVTSQFRLYVCQPYNTRRIETTHPYDTHMCDMAYSYEFVTHITM